MSCLLKHKHLFNNRIKERERERERERTDSIIDKFSALVVAKGKAYVL